MFGEKFRHSLKVHQQASFETDRSVKLTMPGRTPW